MNEISATIPDILAGRSGVAVFGSSEPQPGDFQYEEARRAGGRLAAAGHVVINGGYGGVMAASSQGAREAGGHSIGVTIRDFPRRDGGNEWLTHELPTDDLYHRTRTLVEWTSGYLILQGKAGTLAEVSFLWALRRARYLGSRPVVLAGPHWSSTLSTLQGEHFLDSDTLDCTWSSTTVDGAVDLLLEKLT